MSMTKGEDIDIHQSLNGHYNDEPKDADGYLSGLSSTPKSNDSNLEHKIQTVRTKYADDRDKI